MALKATGDRSQWARVDEFDGGIGWQPYPHEGLQRTSHLLETDAGVVLVDPLDIPDIESLLEDYGPLMGVTVLQTQHTRDAERLATRYDVPLLQPSSVPIDAGAAQVHTIDEYLPGTEFRVFSTVQIPFWREVALYDGDTLVVGDTLGTAQHFRGPGERLGFHPLLRLWRPTGLRSFTPDRILVGHGTGILTDAETVLEAAFTGARRNLPGAWWNGLRLVLGLD